MGSLVGLLTDPQALQEVLASNWLVGLGLAAAIIFIETGVVVMPFLPGDSLLFVLGASAAVAGRSPVAAWAVVAAAAVLGDTINYAVARTAVGPWVVRHRWVREAHLQRTRHYFAHYGGSAITIARFVPVVRTVAPFVAGASDMQLGRFVAFNVLGGVLWAAFLVALGYMTGHLPWVASA